MLLNNLVFCCMAKQIDIQVKESEQDLLGLLPKQKKYY